MKFLLNHDVSCNGDYAELQVATYSNHCTTAICIWHNATGVLIQVSPLLLATQQGHLKVVKILLGHPRIDVTLTNEVGYNALAEAIVKGYRQVVAKE